jgi:hypothetical protein
LCLGPLEASQREILTRVAAANAVRSTAIVEQLSADDAADAITITELVDHARDLLARRYGLRSFLSEVGRSLLAILIGLGLRTTATKMTLWVNPGH